MEAIDLFELRSLFNRRDILLCFNGPISRSLIEEIGNALRNYLQAYNEQPSAAMDVFGIYIEMAQNIRHYAKTQAYDEVDSSATVVIARDTDGHYVIQAGNMVGKTDGDNLLTRIHQLASMDKAELKTAYKTQLRQPRDPNAATGAGLGLIDMARKASQPLSASISPINENRAFFTLRAVI